MTTGAQRPAGANGAAKVEDAREGVIRIMLVDDSAVIRGLFTRAIESDPELQVVASVGDGRMAIGALKRQEIDVAVVDIEMPVMDGLTALPLLLEAKPDLIIIMASTLTRRNADVSLKALAAGAKDYVAKPSSTSELTSATTFKQELIAKIKALAGSRRSPRIERPGVKPIDAGERSAERSPAERATAARINRGGPVVLRPANAEVPELLAIGSSTGGPQALFAVLGNLPATLTQPILITQHMPATFTTILAEHLTRTAKRPCSEAQDGEVLQRGRIYVAPGDFHMVVEPQGTDRVLRLTKAPPENFCRPSVDPMLRSLAALYGRRLLVVILTGMGQDGLRGAETVVQAGGWVVAQDEASSVVWGMPGAVATAGLCSAVMPVGEIGPFIQKIAMRSAA